MYTTMRRYLYAGITLHHITLRCITIHPHIRTYARAHAHTHIHTFTHSKTFARTRIQTYRHGHTDILTYIHKIRVYTTYFIMHRILCTTFGKKNGPEFRWGKFSKFRIQTVAALHYFTIYFELNKTYHDIMELLCVSSKM